MSLHARFPRLSAALLSLAALTFGATVQAAPKVVVTIPALHSLVASIMEGVAEPVLLFDAEEAVGGALTPEQRVTLATADLVVWAGERLERGVAEAGCNAPAMKGRCVALAGQVPLLAPAGGAPADDLMARDLRFWHDPKLAVMAVRHLAPRLAVLDPDHLERYLDNEIELVAKLRGLNRALAARFGDRAAGTRVIAGEMPRYLARRVGFEVINGGVGSPWMRAADRRGCRLADHAERGLEGPTVAIDAMGFGRRAGTGLYFEMMKDNADSLSGCFPAPKTAMSGEGASVLAM
jgi:zinc transport system substrate-binding protein